jgi:hypothetical protein
MKKEFNITEWTLKNKLKEHEGEEYPPYMYSPVGFSCALCKYHYVEWENKIQGKHMCSNKNYQEYKGTAELVDDQGKSIRDPSKWCSNWFMPKGE